MIESVPWPRLRTGFVPLLAALWLTLLELLALLAQPQSRPPPSDVAWLGLATFASTLPLMALFAAFGELAAKPLQHSERSRAGTRRNGVRFAVGLAGLLGAAFAYHLDATAYVRLYLSLHLVLDLLAGSLAFVAFTLLWPRAIERRGVTTGTASAPPPGVRLRSILAVVLLCAAWAGGFGVALVKLLDSPGRTALAVGRTTLLSHTLLLLNDRWGILQPATDEQAPATRAAAEAFVTPRPRAPYDGPVLERTNLLLVTVDSMRWDHVPTGGAMAALAKEGVVFEHAYAPSCWTVASMSALLTSRLPSQLRFTMVSVDANDRLQPHDSTDALVTNPANFRKVTPVPWKEPTPRLQTFLHQAGWQTATAVAYVFYRPEAGITQGFETVDLQPYLEHNRDNSGTTSAPLTDAALRWLGQRDPNRPFFLWLHYMDPHAPYLAQDAAAQGGDERARYDSELRLVDRQLDRLVAGLRAAGVWEDTTVVLHADHGEEFGEHGGQFHATTLYEEQLRVPLVVRLPARARALPGVRHVPVSLLDLQPTLLDLFHLAPFATSVGRSFAQALFGGEPTARPLLAECTRFGRDSRATIAFPYKLLLGKSTGTLELYDLTRDPEERTNLVESAPEPLARLAPIVTAMASQPPTP